MEIQTALFSLFCFCDSGLISFGWAIAKQCNADENGSCCKTDRIHQHNGGERSAVLEYGVDPEDTDATNAYRCKKCRDN